MPEPQANAPVNATSKWWAVPYVLGVVILCYLVIGTELGARIYGGISIALMVWFFCFSVYTLTHMLWLKIHRQRSTNISQ